MEDERLIALLAGSNWPQLFDRKTLRQGREYAQRRCVSDFDMDQSHPRQTRIRANVLDGAPQSYQCSIELRPNPQAAFEISMRCSCPDATQCAHCVAALLEATQRHTGPVPLMLGEPVLANSDSVVTVSVTPKPVLSLRGAPFRSRARRGAERTIGVARLAFDYDGHRVPPDGRAWTRFTHEDRPLRIERMRALEGDARDRLLTFGLVPADQVVGLYLDDAEAARFLAADYVLERGEGRPASPSHLANLLPRLAAAFTLEFEDDFPVELLQAPDQWHVDVRDRDDTWFDVSLGIDVGDQRLDLLPILRQVLADPDFPHEPLPNEAPDAVWLATIDGRRHVPLPLVRLRGLIEPLLEWLARPVHVGGRDPDDGQERLQLRLPQAAILDELPLNCCLLYTSPSPRD